MLQPGVALFVFAAIEGFVIPVLPVPRLGLSVHIARCYVAGSRDVVAQA